MLGRQSACHRALPQRNRYRAAAMDSLPRVLCPLLGVVALILGGSCAPKQTVVGSNEQFEGETYGATHVLSETERSSVVSTMAAALGGGRGYPLVQAPAMMAWEDVPQAAAAGARKVEMAVADSELVNDVWFFTIRTLDDVPGVLRVQKVSPPECVLVTASVGRFDQRDAQSAALVAAFYDRLRAYGRKSRPMSEEMRRASNTTGESKGGGDRPLDDASHDSK